MHYCNHGARGRPKEFRPKPKELILRMTILAESRNQPKVTFSAGKPISAEKVYFGQNKSIFRPYFRPKYSDLTANFGRNCSFGRKNLFWCFGRKNRNLSVFWRQPKDTETPKDAPFGRPLPLIFRINFQRFCDGTSIYCVAPFLILYQLLEVVCRRRNKGDESESSKSVSKPV